MWTPDACDRALANAGHAAFTNCVAAFLAVFAFGCGAETPARNVRSGPPNVVLIVSDDHSYTDYGFMGSSIARTPHIDELAEQGSVFPIAYNTASLCRPSLIALLTGLDPLQWESSLAVLAKQGREYRGLDRIRRFTTLPRVFGQRGYSTFQAGKFWEGSYDQAGFAEGQKHKRAVSVHDLVGWSGGEASQALGRTTIAPVTNFIDAHLDDRFFLWFAPMLPHAPFDAPERYAQRYAKSDMPEVAKGYYANVERLDDAVGELVAHLELRDLRRDTLIVFLADNGWDAEMRGAEPSLAGGDRGKASMYELGWRTPLIFNWPGRVPAGVRHDDLASSLDVFQTLLDYIGVQPLDGRYGISLRSVIEGEQALERDMLIGSDGGARPRERAPGDDPRAVRPPAFFVRDADWHFIWNSETGEEELFAINDDPAETHNLIDEHPELALAYRARIDSWNEQMRVLVNPIPPIVPAPPRAR